MSIQELIVALCDRAIAEEEEFTRLDREVGDGDFGVNIVRGARAVRSVGELQAGDPDLSAFLKEIARKLNAAGCGTSGTLLSFGIAAGAKSPTDLTTFLQLALSKIQVVGETKVGDKTMVDALYPAVEALKAGKSLKEAAKAAKQGEIKTRELSGRRGRALYSQSRAMGVSDPGARLIAVLFDEAARYAK